MCFRRQLLSWSSGVLHFCGLCRSDNIMHLRIRNDIFDADKRIQASRFQFWAPNQYIVIISDHFDDGGPIDGMGVTTLK